ncbi:MAG: carbohydrate binding domain-containing protein [Patescibacteria group bacterium]|jgi:hypothetical protein
MFGTNPPNQKNHKARYALVGFGVALTLTGTLWFGFVARAIPVEVVSPVVVATDISTEKQSLWQKVQSALVKASSAAYRQVISQFLNRMAYDTAVWIATGERGQKPLTIRNWGTYLRDTGEGAVGDFLNSISKDFTGINLCTFNPQTTIKLNVMARRAMEPPKPSCPLNGPNGILANFDRIGQMTISDMIDFQKNFNPESSELGAFMTISSTALQKKSDAEELAKFIQRNTDFLSSKATITGDAKSPPEMTLQIAQVPLWSSIQQYFTYTGNPYGDALKLFGNTLLSKWLSLLKDKGISTPGGMNGAGSGGVAAAKQQLIELAKPDFQTPGALDILNVLSNCPSNVKDRQPENCVIDDRFRAAIDQHLTVKQAIDLGYLEGTRTFGYDATGQEPEYNSGYPYRSLVILRKYRIVPSLWETTALYLKNFHVPAKNYGIKELVDIYDKVQIPNDAGVMVTNPFYHLIDPNWVLVSPEAYCAKEGSGEQLVNEQYMRVKDTNGDGTIDTNDVPVRIVTRSNTYCGDVRTCIDENPDGTCRFYGYCSEERPIWHFKGNQCEPYQNTCTTFRGPDSKTVSYNQSTTDGLGCTADNAGCRWYCATNDTNIEDFDCSVDLNQAAGSKRNFDNGVEKCEAGGKGCNQYLPIAAGTNLAANSSFETFTGQPDDLIADTYTMFPPADHWDWQIAGNVIAVSQPYSGVYSMGVNDANTLTYSIETGAPILNQEYSLSVYAKGPAGCRISLDASGASNNVPLTGGDWQRVSVSGKVAGVPAAQTRLSVTIKPVCGDISKTVYLDDVQLEVGSNVTAYQEYGAGGITERQTTENLISNGTFSVDNGTDYYNKSAFDNDIPYDGKANGWEGAAIITEPSVGYNDNYAADGSGGVGTQDVTVAYGEEYDVSAWVYEPGASPIRTHCLDENHTIVGGACNLSALAGDPRTQFVGANNSGWHFISFSVRNDNIDAAFVRVRLADGSRFDEVSVRQIRKSLDCRVDEIGCDLYKPIERGDSVPGIVRGDDYCSAEFAGCKSYQQMPVTNGARLNLVSRNGINLDLATGGLNAFDLIASSGQSCEAAGVGCEQFTNLDEEARGGEAIQYYKHIRQCLKPDPAQCLTFYRWEGSDVDGMELIAESLKQTAGGAPYTEPAAAGDCDPALDPDCYTFYNPTGASFKRLYSNTVSCSDDCHPLRNTLDGQIYNSIPSQSLKCTANQNNCREYRGSTGYNIRKIIEDTFEDGDTAGWDTPANVTISTESIKPGGLSAKVNGQMSYAANDTTESGKTYMVEFWAKASGAALTLQAGYRSPSGGHPDQVFPGTADLATGQWNRYLLGPLQYDVTVASDEQFVIFGAGNFYIDNIIVWETSGNVYLKYGTFKSCPNAEVGCTAYKNRANETVNVKNFSGLCRLDKVGCTAAIDTHNSTTAFQSTVGSVTTMEDTVRPIVVDSRFSCSAKDKGCTEYGLPNITLDDQVKEFKKVYLKNNPDIYTSSLCNDGHLYCDQYQTGINNSSTLSFRTPGEKTCEYKTGNNVGGRTYDTWFIKGTNKFCPVEKYTCVGGPNAGQICYGETDNVCPTFCQPYQAYPMPARVCVGPNDRDNPEAGAKCYGGPRDGGDCSQLVDSDHPTLGCGDGKCYQPTEICYGGSRAGRTCDSDADPNDDALVDITCGKTYDEGSGYCAPKVCATKNHCDNDATKECLSDSDCSVGGHCMNDKAVPADLESQCGGDQICGYSWVGQCREEASGCSEFRDPQSPAPNMSLSQRVCSNNLALICDEDSDCGGNNTCIPYPGCNASCRVEFDAQGAFYRTDASCKPYPNSAATYRPGCQPYYYVKESVDQASCAGLVNPDEGCELFNDTTSSNGLVFDSDLSRANIDNTNEPTRCDPAAGIGCDSNTVIKVERDRTCNQWLYCRSSYTDTAKGQKERKCLSVGNCRQIGTNGECTRPVGEGQCDNDPVRPCRINTDCLNNGQCLLPAESYKHPGMHCHNAPATTCTTGADCPPGDICEPPDNVKLQSIRPDSHPYDITYPHQPGQVTDGTDKLANMSGYSHVGLTWGCSATGNLCYSDGVCFGGINNLGMCRIASDCPGGTCGTVGPGSAYPDQCPGADNNCNVVHGYYPVAAMRESAGFAIENSGFGDQASHAITPWERYPITNPVNYVEAREKPGIGATDYGLYIKGAVNQGAQINLQTQVKSYSFYTVSFDLYSGGSVAVAAILCHGPIAAPVCNEVGRVQATNQWQRVVLPPNSSYRTGPVSGDVYLRLVNVTAGDQEFYVDNVNILPGLEKKSTQKPVELPTDPQTVQRSCRLYPQEDAPSCEYMAYDDGSNTAVKISQKGWYGYCLEYDPRNSNMCLQWWPVDKIKSETLTGDPQPGLAAPMYQCLQEGIYEFRRAFQKTGFDHDCIANGDYSCPIGYQKTQCWKNERTGRHDKCVLFCIPNGISKNDVCPGYPGSRVFYHPGYWTQWDGGDVFYESGAEDGGLGAVEIIARRCDVVGQVVTPLGENRAWNNRVRVGAYNVWDIGYTKAADMDPYGSIVPPLQSGTENDINDPATWNSRYNENWGGTIYDGINASPPEKQPLYVLEPSNPRIPSYFDEPDWANKARAGSPYACKHGTTVYSWTSGFPPRLTRSTAYLCDDTSQYGATTRYYPRETFAGAYVPGNCARGSTANECKGVGLKRLQRLFTNVYGVWIWSDGKCITPSANICTGNELAGNPCADATECNVANGQCSSKKCVGGTNDGSPCGCPGGEVCSLGMKCDAASGALNGQACGLGACTAVGDSCVTDRCSGGVTDQQACNPANVCSAGETCTRGGGEDKCVDDSNSTCDCPNGGTCTAYTFCANDLNLQCGNDAGCAWACDMDDDGNGDGVFCISGDNSPCGVAPNPLHNCQPVSGRCSAASNRCSNSMSTTCNDTCDPGYTCSAGSKCVNPAIGQCACPGAGAFCAQGVCSNDGGILCSAANQAAKCGGANTCVVAANVCLKENARCDCGSGGGTCVESQRCSLTGGNCDVSACVDGLCSDFFCVGGGSKEGVACTGLSDTTSCFDNVGTCSNGSCTGTVDGLRDGVACNIANGNADCWAQGQCVTAICVNGGINEAGACASDAACLGTTAAGACTAFNGVCMDDTVVPNMTTGTPCRVGGPATDCVNELGVPFGYCAAQTCAGGIRDSQDCSAAAPAQADRDKWCNLQEGTVGPLEQSYLPALSTNPIYSQITSDFNNMNQCRCPGGVCGLFDVRPNETSFPNDFCWVQPAVFNIKINARSQGDITIPNGGGTASLQFNTTVNLEQLPVRWINVDWGDGTTPDTIKFTPGIFAKEQPTDPHLMLHDYSGAGGPYTVRVWIEDNWEKGSGYCTGGANNNKNCSGDGDCPGGVCEGVCRGSGANDFKHCNAVNATAQCGGAPGYCSSVYQGRITVTL